MQNYSVLSDILHYTSHGNYVLLANSINLLDEETENLPTCSKIRIFPDEYVSLRF